MSHTPEHTDAHGHEEHGHGHGVNYLNWSYTVKDWLLTGDHKRIGILYLVSTTIFFIVGGLAAAGIRAELLTPKADLFSPETYNKIFSAHGIVMIFFFLIPSIPATLGNFFIPLMIGAKDLAFPRLNLLSWYVYMLAGTLGVLTLIFGGIETGWTFYTPYSSTYSNGNVVLAIFAAFFAGFSSIFTGINFIATIHKMRAPGMTWFRLPLFVWAHYATSIIMVLGTPVVAITLLLLVAERSLNLGIYNPNNGGDPVLFQHMFWFYSHPAVYIMILPGMGVISEIIACFSRKRIFGYSFVAFSSLAIALLGFFVWGHHMFTTGQSMYLGMVFSILSFMVAVPSAIKVFNWASTLFKGRVSFHSPMMFALGFMGLFLIGGLTGLFLSTMGTDIHLQDTYFVVAHFHYVMVGGAIMAYLGGVHFWWPKMTGRMYNETLAKISAILIFVGFNATFFPQFIVGYLGMPRRYAVYPEEFQFWHVLSTMGGTLLALGYALPGFYLLASLFKGAKAPANPWGAVGLEWVADSPPDPHNFHAIPVVTWEAYEYDVDGEASIYDEPLDAEDTGRTNYEGESGATAVGHPAGD
jgi:cytochrome c oxidase subunit 1